MAEKVVGQNVLQVDLSKDETLLQMAANDKLVRTMRCIDDNFKGENYENVEKTAIEILKIFGYEIWQKNQS